MISSWQLLVWPGTPRGWVNRAPESGLLSPGPFAVARVMPVWAVALKLLKELGTLQKVGRRASSRCTGVDGWGVATTAKACSGLYISGGSDSVRMWTPRVKFNQTGSALRSNWSSSHGRFRLRPHEASDGGSSD